MSTIDKTVRIPGVKDGDTFRIGDMEFIKFPDRNGETPVVMKSVAFISRFGSDNDLRCSDVLKRLKSEHLPKVMESIGAENLCTIRTDLTTLDGLTPYGTMESFVSLPTLDFYRANIEIFDKYKLNDWWWLATPESAPPHSSNRWVLCVFPSGYINCVNSGSDFGVRPFYIFKSSIFESSGE